MLVARTHTVNFSGVAVSTPAIHVHGAGFEPQRNHISIMAPPVAASVDCKDLHYKLECKIIGLRLTHWFSTSASDHISTSQISGDHQELYFLYISGDYI